MLKIFEISAFFSILYFLSLQRVRQFYQDANIGPTIEDVQFTTTLIGKPTINPSIQTVSEGWDIQDHNGLNKVCKELTYTSTDQCDAD